MAEASLERTLNVPFEKLFKVITDYESYPQFVDGVTGVKVLERASGKAKVQYSVSIMKDFTYVLSLEEDASAGRVHWTLVESDFFKVNIGGWTLKDVGGGKTTARYDLNVEFRAPVPGFILKRLVSGSLPSMMDAFEKRAKAL